MNFITYNQLSLEEANFKIKSKNIKFIGEYKNTKEKCLAECFECGHRFYASYDRLRKVKIGCPICRDKLKRIGKYRDCECYLSNKRIGTLLKKKSEFVEIIQIPKEESDIKCKCLLCNKEFYTSFESLILGSIHKSCSAKISNSANKLSIEEIMERVKQRGYNVALTVNSNDENLFDAVCNVCNHRWQVKRNILKNKGGCPMCAKAKRADTNSQRKKSQCLADLDKWGLELLSNYCGATKNIKVKCKDCGNEFETTYKYQVDNRIGCVKCNKQKSLLIKSNMFLDSLKKNNKHIFALSEYIGCDINMDFECDICQQSFSAKPHDLSKNWNCPNCTTNSRLEDSVKRYLLDNGIDYCLHKRFEGLRGVNNGLLSYDFYLPNKNILIECQGQQHMQSIDYFGGEDRLIVQNEHDKRKKEYAEQHGYKFIEIFYYDLKNVYDILQNSLVS